MTIQPTSSDNQQPRDAAYWAQYAKTFKVGRMPKRLAECSYSYGALSHARPCAVGE